MAELVEVASFEQLEPGHPKLVTVGDRPVCVVRLADDSVHAIHDVCTHAEESLSEGWVEGDRIECPRHGAFFSLRDGAATTPPATLPVPVFRVEVHQGRVLVDPTPDRPHPLLDDE
jgi:nitrite reductase/ring-hydroxylating ferredoxin subunit